VRWISSVLVFLVLSGCGGLERHSYPVKNPAAYITGIVVDVQPFKGEASESGASRAVWGTLSGGLVAGVASGLSDSEIGTFHGFSLVVTTTTGATKIVNTMMKAAIGDCISAYINQGNTLMTFEKNDSEVCHTLKES